MLFKLLTLPITGPVDALSWVADTIANAADDALHDPTALRQELELAEARLQRGEMTEAEYEEVEQLLIQRLREAGQRMAAKEAR